MATVRNLRPPDGLARLLAREGVAIGLALLTLGVSFMSAFLSSSALGIAAIACGAIAAVVGAWALSPERLLGAWGLVLLVYVAWPIGTETYAFLHLAVEYLVLLTLIGSIILSAILRDRFAPSDVPAPFYVLGSLFLIYAAMSFVWVIDLSLWVQYTVMWIVYLGVFFGLAAAVIRMDQKGLIASLALLAWCIAAFGVVGVIRTQADSLIHGGSVSYWALFSPLVRFRISEDLTLLLGIPLNLFLYHQSGRRRYLALLAVTVLATLLSFSRTGAVGLAVLAVVSAVVLRGRHLKRFYAVTALIFAAIVVLRLIGFRPAVAVFDRLASTSLIQQIWFGRLNPDDPGGGRQLILQEGIRIFKENPFFGTGVGNYMAHFNNSIPTTHTTPHNAYLAALAEYGLVGSSLILAFWGYLTVLLWRRAMALAGAWRTLGLGLAGLNVALLVMGLGAEFFDLPYFWFFGGLAVGLVTRQWTREGQVIGVRAPERSPIQREVPKLDYQPRG